MYGKELQPLVLKQLKQIARNARNHEAHKRNTKEPAYKFIETWDKYNHNNHNMGTWHVKSIFFFKEGMNMNHETPANVYDIYDLAPQWSFVNLSFPTCFSVVFGC